MVTAPHLSAISPARLCHHRHISEACISTNNNVFSFNTTYFRDNDSGSVGNVQAAVVCIPLLRWIIPTQETPRPFSHIPCASGAIFARNEDLGNSLVFLVCSFHSTTTAEITLL